MLLPAQHPKKGRGLLTALGLYLVSLVNFSCETQAKADILYLEKLQSAFRQVAAKALPVVVEITVHQPSDSLDSSLWDFLLPPDINPDKNSPPGDSLAGLGSGIIVEQRNTAVYVITNYHVIEKAADLRVILFDGRSFPAQLKAKDERTDLALISFNCQDQLAVARLGDSDSLQVGDWAIAIGNPYGFQSSLTVGVISALGRAAIPGSNIASYNDYIQTDAEINPGNSGGPLLNLWGEVVGINTWIASQTGSSTGLGFAIPINSVKKVIADFLSKGKVEYGWLGVAIIDPLEASYPGLAEDLFIKDLAGALVVNVFKDSPADKHGILPGDFIIQVAGQDIANATQLTRLIGSLAAHHEYPLVIIRYGQRKALKITLAVRDSEEQVRSNPNIWPGLIAVQLKDNLRQRLNISPQVSGLLLIEVSAASRAAAAGLKLGDILTKINGKPQRTLLDFYQTFNDLNISEFKLSLWRDGREITTVLRR